MPLPTIEVPKFKLKIPSTGKMVTYRPFLVKEEKVLLQALETGEGDEQILDAVFDLLNACIETKNVSVRDLTNFDLEYLFVQLRAKSVGENAQIQIRCMNPECGKQYEYECNITEFKIKKNKDEVERSAAIDITK